MAWRKAGAVAAAIVLLVVLGALTLRGVERGSGLPPIPEGSPPLAASELPALIEAAKAEGKLNLIAMPKTWANYGEIIAAFEKTFGIDVSVESPNATSAQELTALRMMKGQDRMPDIIEIGPGFVDKAVNERLVQPYKVTVWDQIPDELKDPNGNWTAPYYGLIVFGTNTNKVAEPPTSWKALDNPRYAGQFALNGDPRSATSPLSAVWSASLANGGSLDDIVPGITYFNRLRAAGIYIPLQANVANLANQQITVLADWTFVMPGAKRVLGESGIGFVTTTPSDGLFGGYYADAITYDAPHPNAAKLWLEWVTALEGRQLYLTGGAIPALYPQMVAAGEVPPDVQETLPSVEELKSLKFPDPDQTSAATNTILSRWAAGGGQ